MFVCHSFFRHTSIRRLSNKMEVSVDGSSLLSSRYAKSLWMYVTRPPCVLSPIVVNHCIIWYREIIHIHFIVSPRYLNAYYGIGD